MPNRGKKRKVGPNVTQRATGATPNRRPNTLPSRYNFTPAGQDPPPLQTPEAQVGSLQRQSPAQIRNYTPPQQLFQNSSTHPPPPKLHRTPSEEVHFNPRTQGRSHDVSPPSPVRPSQTQARLQVRSQARSREVSPPSPVRPSQPQARSQSHPSHPSSQGNNFEEESSPVLPELQSDVLRALNALLVVPDRDQFTTVLSPTPAPNTQCF
ncbi:PREDICTED: serine/arginine repetitive matrix protein 1-like [Camelina sativa]|uniref:Serine/arginine repetitive matrix protein 1-like n=1 Tax=Camelina sativa TaxID=90675 RepID=A0ABM0WBR2_CAMSA|nr:PREDICTED: serine/arginine repetitive matrix protein 1-like [Camelina sativa]